jgi:hypothetical protein
MLYSVVDDRSGVAYQEYHEVYGEDVGAALKFLFNAMSAKTPEAFPFQGISKMLYMENSPISRNRVFQKVMNYLGIEIRTHVPQVKDGNRVTSRAKGKFERPFRTVKEMHKTLYHLHEPESITEANTWLMQFLRHYNQQALRYFSPKLQSKIVDRGQGRQGGGKVLHLNATRYESFLGN